jgi:hypothetical protein
MKKNGGKPVVVVDGSNISFEDIIAVARDGVEVRISKDKNFIHRMEKTQKILMDSMSQDIPVYGVNTGYGKSCGSRMSMNIALKNGENPEVAEAIFSHYLPRFSGDAIPKDIIGQLISIADKIDSITGSFGIGVQPTGSQDPYGLRRQALGIICILKESDLNINVEDLIKFSIDTLKDKITEKPEKIIEELKTFFCQRLLVLLIDGGYRYDIVDSALERGW